MGNKSISMKPKKYARHNINRNSGMYFVIGLVLVLLLTYLALEWKTYERNQSWDLSIKVEDDIIEEAVVLRKEIKTPPPKQVKAPPVIEIREDDEEIIETFIESSESDINTEVISIDSIANVDDEEHEEIPFIVIEEVPVFPGCEKSRDKRSCFQEMIRNHIKKNFRYPQLAQEMELQGRVNVLFVIHTDGSIKDIRMRGPHKILEEEAARIIATLPNMTPGRQRGKEVKVPFSVPIVFKLQ